MLYYFNNELFKIAYSLLPFVTVALLMSYCLLAVNVLFFRRHCFPWCFFKILYIYILDNSLLYFTLIKNSFPLSSLKEFLYQLVFLATNW